jgi:hypothetical protein
MVGQRGRRIYLVRDVFQVISVLISALMIVAIFRRAKRYGERRRDWLALIAVGVLTIVFYIFVFIDQNFIDLFNASDVSSTVRLAVEGLLLAFVFYYPRRVNL